MTEQLPLLFWRDVLLDAGWDAIASDVLGEVAARMDRPPGGGLWTLVVDPAGRFKLKVIHTRAGSVKAQQMQSTGLVTVAVEDRQIMSITGRLGSSVDLKLVLQELNQLAVARVGAMDSHHTEETSA